MIAAALLPRSPAYELGRCRYNSFIRRASSLPFIFLQLHTSQLIVAICCRLVYTATRRYKVPANETSIPEQREGGHKQAAKCKLGACNLFT